MFIFKARFLLISLVTCFAMAQSVFAFDGGVYFEKKCLSCHTIGGGDDVGPDLKGVVQNRDKVWLRRFIRESQSMVEEGDPIAVELFNKYRKKKMPDQELSDNDLDELIAFLRAGKAPVSNQDFKLVAKATAYDIEKGKNLFIGNVPFEKGGVACLSCHSAGDVGPLGGGKLGPDLTNSFSSYNDKGLSKVLTRISFPTMVEIYQDRPLTEDEVFQVKSFLYEVDKKGKTVTGYTKKFLFLGLIGFLLVLGFFDLLWKDRRKNTRRPKHK